MSASQYDVQLNQSYNFSLLAPQILSNGYSDATLKAIIDYDLANTIKSVGSLHAAALNSLPNGTPSDPTQLVYYKLKTSTGAIEVIAEAWLSAAPVLVSTTSLTVKISNTNYADMPRLSALLAANGFTSFAFQ
jgi:hypothetical protein